MNKVLGILGGGQLGLMMIMESKKLGVKFLVHDEDPEAPALGVADGKFVGDSWRALINKSDVVTFEFEHVNPNAVSMAESLDRLRPGSLTIWLKQDKIREKAFLKDHGFLVPRFVIVNGLEEMNKAVNQLGRVVFKEYQGAYDGKGQYYVMSRNDLGKVPRRFPLLAEEFVDIHKEVSVVLVRSSNGDVLTYSVTENYHYNGVLLYSIAPAEIDEEIASRAKEIAVRLTEVLNHVGVLTVEFFITKSGEVLINEFAPRVHNSGHWTLMGAAVSQFENHVRAVLDLPLGSVELQRPSGIVNMLGVPYNEEVIRRVLAVPGTSVWWYGKARVKPRRKMGHVNIVANNVGELRKRINEVLSIVYGNDIGRYVPPWNLT
ncbi:phosphoribosylaminoimidazole carboxylase, ATPase subunit [Vulcanisaeta moutnovskia 768-28]|uniref:N5-carboxyaminoimidazole ribonucleotide synthase n=1 Tax=Vulcanisaeta moutnovskia (strain 768-28) TaxID=985053 RepID=F0QVW0_VULM7|nr:5-(carboxyamino)imidazole ribonucleotide synthase [Vulcanisaeta moutnovskia]ADY02134.1 phosphoribosylaminoimidazole carboxylase, ATPase subunit [Vulcanisaeta moutnovskia 768-28]